MSDNLKPSFADDLNKFWLAVSVLALCFIGLVAVTIVLYHADSNLKIEAAKLLFNVLVPLIGSWVGAILAYYFGAKQSEATQAQQRQAFDIIQRQMDENRALTHRALELSSNQNARG